MSCYEEVYFGPTPARVDRVVGDWTRTVAEVKTYPVDWTQELQSAGMQAGMIETSPPIPRGRRIDVVIRSQLTGTVANATGAGHDEVEAILDLFDPGQAESELVTVRRDTNNNKVERAIIARPLEGAAYNILDSPGGGAGPLVNEGGGLVEVTIPMYCRHPFWRQTPGVGTPQSVQVSQGTPQTLVLANGSGQKQEGGLLIDTSAFGTLPTTLTITNAANGSQTVITFGSDVDAVLDFFHTSPTEWSATLDGVGGTLSTGTVSLVPGSNTLTFTIGGAGGSGALVAVSWWEWYRTP